MVDEQEQELEHGDIANLSGRITIHYDGNKVLILLRRAALASFCPHKGPMLCVLPRRQCIPRR